MVPVLTSATRRRVAAGRAWWIRSLYGSGWRRIRELDLDTHALALCAQQVLCTAPLIVAVGAVLQRTTGNHIGVIISRFFGLHDDSADYMERLFGRSSPSISTGALLFAMLTAVVFSTSVGAVQQRAFEMIWTLPRISSIRSYLRQLFWAIGLGVFSAGELFTSWLGRLFNHHAVPTGPWAGVILETVLTFLFYWWSQHWLLGARVDWRSLFPGAVAVAIGTTILVRLSRLVMPPQISWQAHAYGLIGGVFVLSVWLMILSAVIFGGVLLGALLVQRRTATNRRDPGNVNESPLTIVGLESAANGDIAALPKDDANRSTPSTDTLPA